MTHRAIAASVLVAILTVAGIACGGEEKSEVTIDPVAQMELTKALTEIYKGNNAASAATSPDANPTTKQTVPTQVAASVPTTTSLQPTVAPTSQPAPTQAAPTAPPPPQTVNGLAHRGAGSFNPGEAVVGYEITMGGLKYRQCYLESAPSEGTVSDGVINPWPGEVIYSACGQGVEDPDTVNGRARRGAGSFSAGEAVSGYEIAIGGLKYRLCYFRSAPGNGTVSDGVINPYPGEVLSPCGEPLSTAPPTPATNPDTVNGKERRGPGPFAAGEPVTGFFTMDGKKYDNCYMANPSAAGVVTDGVINPWKNEVADDRVC